MTDDTTKLTDKQRAFIDAYLLCWNASEAARRAGYSERTAGSIGGENLKKPEIQSEIKRRIEENAMTTDEALSRLGRQARSSMADFVSVQPNMKVPMIDWQKAQALGALDVVKKIKITTDEISFELYDAQSALVHILKQLTLDKGEPTERFDVTDNTTDEARADRIAAILDRARARRDGQPDSGGES